MLLYRWVEADVARRIVRIGFEGSEAHPDHVYLSEDPLFWRIHGPVRLAIEVPEAVAELWRVRFDELRSKDFRAPLEEINLFSGSVRIDTP